MTKSGKTERIRKRSIIPKKGVKKVAKKPVPAKKKVVKKKVVKKKIVKAAPKKSAVTKPEPKKKGRQLFQPGESGNPKGRPKGSGGLVQARTIIQRYLDSGKRLHPIQFLINVYNNPKSALKQRLDAAEVIASYLYGKPQQAIDLDVDSNTLDITIKRRDES